MNKHICAASILALLLSAGLVQSHHSSAPHFDKDSEVTIIGTVTELKLVNPHAYLYIDAEANGGTVSWRCELSSSTQLKRLGWSKDMFANSGEITVSGDPAWREDNVCFLNSFTLSNGTTVRRNGDIGNIDMFPTAEVEDVVEIDIENRPDYLENGQPNLQGPWVTLSFGRNAREGIRARFQATDAGKAAVGEYDMAFDDPILRCHFVNIFNAWNHDSNVNDIYQSDDKIVLQYGFMDLVRTIHMGMDEHPANLQPSPTGHSIGSWDGDTLVVDTIGFEEGVLNHQNGMKHSQQMHAIERFYVNKEDNKLYRDYTLTDSPYLIGETKGQDVMALSTTPYTAYGCVELSGKNNIRPTDERYNQVDAEGNFIGSTIESSDNVQQQLKAPESAQEEKSWWQFWD